MAPRMHRSAHAAVAFIFLGLASAGPFEPHRLPNKGPWFEGWYTRIIDSVANRSVAVIVGSFQAQGHQMFSSSWAALLATYPNGTMYTEQVFPKQSDVKIFDRGQPVAADPPKNRPSVFQVSSDVGTLSVNDSHSSLSFTFPSGFSVSATLSRRVPWDSSCPDECGPEGWTSHVPARLVPTHYFVHTLASNAVYSVNGENGVGFAHQEANYGGYFPTAWVWVQGVAGNGETTLLLTGGEFTVAGATVKQFIVGYRSQRFKWNFRGVDLDQVRATIDGCASTLKISAVSVCRQRRLEIEVSAPPTSFSQPLFFPTPAGWSNDPGCVESYVALARAVLYDQDNVELETIAMPQVALEFGGAYRCKTSAPRNESTLII
mmetsp:Transcript_21879/g.61166  ORF Transcript_21879/g.61166 Transcript_21879/m.61166 type:complete len:375 (+) Transcript_21879:83-1207(+)